VPSAFIVRSGEWSSSRHIHVMSIYSIHANSCHFMSLMSIHIYVIDVISCHFTSFHVISRHFMSFHDISCHFMSFHVISCHFMSFHVVACHSFHSCQFMSCVIKLFLKFSKVGEAQFNTVTPLCHRKSSNLLDPLMTAVGAPTCF
jgi:hypothetical protein